MFFLFRFLEIEVSLLLKIRLQGNKKELRRMMKLLQKNQRCQIGYTSNFMQCDDNKFYRLYLTMYLCQKEKHQETKK